MIRVLICDDHEVVREGLRGLIGRQAGMSVVGEAGTVAEAVAAAARSKPDVVIMDYRLPDQTGAEASTAIKHLLPDTAVLFLSADDSDGAVFAAVKSGASGYLLKTEAGTELLRAVHRAADGEMLMPAWQLARLIAERKHDGPSPPESDLTPRQMEVLRMMAEGLGTKAIAEHLNLKPSTAAWHVQTILEKLDAHSRLEAVAHATQRGLLTH